MNTLIRSITNNPGKNTLALLAASVMVAGALFIREGQALGDSSSVSCAQVLIEKCGVNNSRPCSVDQRDLIQNECESGQAITFDPTNQSPTTVCKDADTQLASMQATFQSAQDKYQQLETNRINMENAVLNLKTVVGVGPLLLTVSRIQINSGDYFSIGATIPSVNTTSYVIDLLQNNVLVSNLLPAKTIADTNRPSSIGENLQMPAGLASGTYQLRITDPANPTLASVMTVQVN